MLTLGAIVVSAGLAVGIVAGVTWEEPGLVFGWLSGETDGIKWGLAERDIAESSPIPDGVLAPDEELVPTAGLIRVIDVAAPPPLAGRTVDAHRSGASATAPTSPVVVRPKFQPASSRPSDGQDEQESAKIAETGDFSVQVGAFSEREGADELSASLRRAGYPVYLSDSKQGARWRVRVGPHTTRAAAENTAKRLEASQKLPTWVLREDS